MNQGSKYYPLYKYLYDHDADEIVMTFSEIEALIDRALATSARTRRAWWSNRGRGAVQAAAWMAAGYHVEELNLDAEEVTFRKPGQIYHVDRDGDTVLWNATMIKALRYHLKFSQAELADQLGMRQQTISDWEIGSYIPRRSNSKYLTMFADRANFTYDTTSKKSKSDDDDNDDNELEL